QCGDLGLTSDKILGQGNINVAGLLIEPASSRGPYDDRPTVTQGVVVYNLTYDELDSWPLSSSLTPYSEAINIYVQFTADMVTGFLK
ncbi:MAG TPA: hypothetical protein VH681_10745, partial [Nitrospiraceae bacterium]